MRRTSSVRLNVDVELKNKAFSIENINFLYRYISNRDSRGQVLQNPNFNILFTLVISLCALIRLQLRT